MVARFGGDIPYPSAVASMESPLMDLSTEHCMTFRYFIRSNLTVISRTKSDPVGDVLFQVRYAYSKSVSFMNNIPYTQNT